MRDDLSELRRLSDAATPGPWSVSGVRRRYDAASCVLVDAPSCPGLFALATDNGKAALHSLADAKFMVAAVAFARRTLDQNRGGEE